MSRYYHLCFIILLVCSSLILSKNLFKKSFLKNENSISDKTSKIKALQINPNSCSFYFNYPGTKNGILTIKCGNDNYPMYLSNLITFKDKQLQINSLGSGNLNEKCRRCRIDKNLEKDNKYQILLYCVYCRDNVDGEITNGLSLDLRPILINYFEY